MQITSMREDDFFAGWDPDSEPSHRVACARPAGQVMNGPLPGVPDIELCDGLVHLIRTEFTAFGTGKTQRITDADSRLLLRACKAACTRVVITFPSLPFRDLEGFKQYWIEEEMANNYAKRRRYLEIVFGANRRRDFEPIGSEPGEMSWSRRYLHVAGPGGRQSTPRSDELRQQFAVAQTAQDHCAVGAACVRVLEHLGEVAFDPAVHLTTRCADPSPEPDEGPLRGGDRLCLARSGERQPAKTDPRGHRAGPGGQAPPNAVAPRRRDRGGQRDLSRQHAPAAG